MIYHILKRFIDFSVAFIILFLFFPVLMLVFFSLLISIGWPVFFVQYRPGKNKQLFKLYKFRTMSNDYDSEGQILPDNLRLTKLGQWLRETSLDELPSLFCVLKGEMSLVGPRPLLVEYLPLYNPSQQRRHNVLPGITGWAQVNGRNSISWDEKFEYDVWYVENQSFWLDMKIIWMTIKKVIAREGISADGEATMPKFTGSKSSKIK